MKRKLVLADEYIAGLFDGEACIDVQRTRQKSGRSLYVRPRVRLAMSVTSVVLREALLSRFGGYVSNRKSLSPKRNDSWTIEWHTTSQVLRLLEVLAPHMILKREQAQLALWWLKNFSGFRARLNERHIAGTAQSFMREQMTAMKKDPLMPSAFAEKRLSELLRQLNANR